MDCSMPGFPVLYYLPEFAKICPLSPWCHSTISSSVASFSSCPQSFPASESFLMSCLFSSGGQIIVASALAFFLPINIQCWFPVVLTGLISLHEVFRVVKGTGMKGKWRLPGAGRRGSGSFLMGGFSLGRGRVLRISCIRVWMYLALLSYTLRNG